MQRMLATPEQNEILKQFYCYEQINPASYSCYCCMRYILYFEKRRKK